MWELNNWMEKGRNEFEKNRITEKVLAEMASRDLGFEVRVAHIHHSKKSIGLTYTAAQPFTSAAGGLNPKIKALEAKVLELEDKLQSRDRVFGFRCMVLEDALRGLMRKLGENIPENLQRD